MSLVSTHELARRINNNPESFSCIALYDLAANGPSPVGDSTERLRLLGSSSDWMREQYQALRVAGLATPRHLSWGSGWTFNPRSKWDTNDPRFTTTPGYSPEAKVRLLLANTLLAQPDQTVEL